MDQRHTTLLDPESLPPATPIIDPTANTIQILLPIHKIDNAPAATNRLADDLLTRLTTAPLPWIEPLWHRIRPMAPIHVLSEHIQQRRMLHICSDASVDAAKYSCCAWIIHTTTDLWHGKGVVPGNCEDNYSGRSEAFGLLTALQFLQHYTNHFPSPQPTNRYQATIYCDSESVINRINRHARESPPFPNTTIEDDYDVYQEINQLIGALPQFMVTFQHVKGHQDQKKQ